MHRPPWRNLRDWHRVEVGHLQSPRLEANAPGHQGWSLCLLQFGLTLREVEGSAHCRGPAAAVRPAEGSWVYPHQLLRLHIPEEYHKQLRQVNEDTGFQSSASLHSDREGNSGWSLPEEPLGIFKKPPSWNSHGNFIHNFHGLLE